MTQAANLASFGSNATTLGGTACQAWVNFTNNGSADTINASYNVSSVTRTGTGTSTINFTNALIDANYAVAFGVTAYASNNAQGVLNIASTGSFTPVTKTSTQLAIVSGNGSSGANYDYNNNSIMIFR